MWEGKRRFNEFFVLNETLSARWPGIPIPFIPEKKAIGNKDLAFLQDRTFYLMRFLQKVSRFDFIIESPEFQLFSRPQGMSIEKSLKGMMPMSVSQKYERIKQVTQIQDNAYDSSAKDGLKQQLGSFQLFCRTVQPLLTQKKMALAHMMKTKQVCHNSYAMLAQGITRYEDMNMSNYLEFQTQNLVFLHPNNGPLLSRMEQLSQNLHNPYIELYHWAKGEVFDLLAVNAVVKATLAQFQKTIELTNKKQSTEKDLRDVNAGNKTLTTLFKNANDTTEMANKVE